MKLDLKGKRFGRLLVIRKLDTRRRKLIVWECKCDCGNTSYPTGNSLRVGHTKSCGCNQQAGRWHRGWKGEGELTGNYWCQIKNHARRRGINFKVSIKTAWKKFLSQKGRCALSGIPIGFPKGKYICKEQTASIDRIDSTKGYTSNNIQWVHKTIQGMKMNWPEKVFISMCKKVSENNK